MKRSCAVATGLLITLPMVATPPVQAATGAPPPAPRVVVDRLDNPRQLSWDQRGRTLVIAEAGRGGPRCATASPEMGPQCTGPTGAVSTVSNPWARNRTVRRVITGLPSVAGPNGAFAGGHTGADAVEAAHPGDFVTAGNALGDPSTNARQGAYFVADNTGHAAGAPPANLLPGGRDFFLSLVNLYAAEKRFNPGKRQIESNPYAIAFYDPTPRVADNDGFALVADAGANTVWKIAPDYKAAVPAVCKGPAPPPANFDLSRCIVIRTTVFASWPDRSSPQAREIEFVPTSVVVNSLGNVFVGGLGSEVPGGARVHQFNLAGKVVRTWTGFTGVTGVAADRDSLYVSQLFGSTPPHGGDGPPAFTRAPGSVVKTSRTSTTAARYEISVPFPAGVAVDAGRNVYVAVNSIAPAKGVKGLFGPGTLSVGGGAIWDLDFRGARLVRPTPLRLPTAPPGHGGA